MNLKIMSWNVTARNWRDHEDSVLEVIDVQSPDVICMQEASPFVQSTLLDHLEARGYRLYNTTITAQENWNPIAVRTKPSSITGYSTALFPPSYDCPPIRAISTIFTNEVIISNVHLCHYSSKENNEKQGVFLAQYLKRQTYMRDDRAADRFVILCGDFNSPGLSPQTDTFDYLTGNRDPQPPIVFTDAHKATGRMINRLGHIMCSEESLIRSTTIIQEKGGSDHRPIMATIDVKE